MKTKQIEVTVTDAGEVKVEAQGFIGKTCEEATKFIEQAIGKVTSRKHKQERWKKEVRRCQTH